MDQIFKSVVPLLQFVVKKKSRVSKEEVYSGLNEFWIRSVSSFYSDLFFLKSLQIIKEEQKNYFLIDFDKWKTVMKENGMGKTYFPNRIQNSCLQSWWLKWGQFLQEQ